MTSRDIYNSTIKSLVTLFKSYFHTLPFSSCQNHDMPYLILYFQFSRMLRNNRQILNLCRQKCQVSVADNGVATLALAAPPVNTLNAELLSSIKTSIDQGIFTTSDLNKDGYSLKRILDPDNLFIFSVVADGAKACIVTSARPGVFSAGLDIMSMYGRTDDELRAYWTHVQDMWLSLYMAPIPMIAAVNGAAPAGGCLMALSCDYRVMAQHPKFNIGLNETLLGIVAPTWVRCVQELS